MNSSDHGITWDSLYTATASIYNLYHNKNILQEDKLIIKENSSSVPIKLSINSGQDWNILNLPSGVSGLYADYAIDGGGNIYALYDTLYKSYDNGVTWEEVNAAPKNPDPDVHSSYSKICIDPAGTIYMSVSSSEFIPPANSHWWENYYSSEDEGATWQHILNGGLYSENGKMFTVNEQDLFISLSVSPHSCHYNKDFIPVIRNYPIHYISSAVINKFGLIYVTVSFTNSEGVYYSNNDGDSWDEENSGLSSSPEASSMLIDSLGYLYVGTNEGIFKSNFTSFNFITDSAIVFEDTKIADTTFKSVTIINPYPFTLDIDSLVTYPNDFFISDIGNGSIDPLDSIDITIAYSPTEFGTIPGSVFLYFNGISGKFRLFGKSPRPVLIFEPVHNFGVVDVGQSKTDTIWVSNHSLNDIIVDSMYLVNDVDFSVGELIFPQLLGQNDSLMITATYTPSSSFIVERDTLAILSNAGNSTAKISLYGIGRNPVGVEENDDIVTDFTLSQNFPNPFNPTTKIKYSVPIQSHVKLVVYNSLGEVIRTLVDQTKEKGNYVVNFNGENLSSGIYFCRMYAGDYNQVRKLILIK